MQCPHCNQEHPDSYKYCPLTGNEIVRFKMCTNPDCKMFGKQEYPSDNVFCPYCGSKLEYLQKNNLKEQNKIQLLKDPQLLYRDPAQSLEIEEFSIYDILWGTSRIEDFPDLEWMQNDGGYKANIGDLCINADCYEKITSIFSHSIPEFLHDFWQCEDSWDKEKWESFSSLSGIVRLETNIGNQIEVCDDLFNVRLQFGNDGTLRYVLITAPQNKVLDIEGIVLGRTNSETLIQDSNHIRTIEGTQYYIKNGYRFDIQGEVVDIVEFENTSDMPYCLKELGFDWELSYNDYSNLAQQISDNVSISSPKIESKKGRDVLVGSISFNLDEWYEIYLGFNNGNKRGEGTSLSSKNTLDSITLTYLR